MLLKETVASYYLRLDNLSQEAKIEDAQIIRGVYLDGLKSNEGLYGKVVNKINVMDYTLDEVHRAALESERAYLLIKSNKGKTIENRKDNLQLKETPRNKVNSPYKQNIYNNNNSKNNNKYNDNKTRIKGICKYCLKEHDYKECQEKFKFYTFEEANVITKVGGFPMKRSEYPKPEERITIETPWVKKRLENLEKRNTSTQTQQISNQQIKSTTGVVVDNNKNNIKKV